MIRATPAPRRVRPGLLILLLLCVGLAGHALWDHVERRRLVTEIERIHVQSEAGTAVVDVLSEWG